MAWRWKTVGTAVLLSFQLQRGDSYPLSGNHVALQS
jgi:hypothetical protein